MSEHAWELVAFVVLLALGYWMAYLIGYRAGKRAAERQVKK